MGLTALSKMSPNGLTKDGNRRGNRHSRRSRRHSRRTRKIIADDRWYVQLFIDRLALAFIISLVTNDDGSLRFVLRT